MDLAELKKKAAFYENLTKKYNLASPFIKSSIEKWNLASPETIGKYWAMHLEGGRPAYLSLYVHVPFCRERKCRYCMYCSAVTRGGGKLAEYADYMRAEMEFYGPIFEGRKFSTVHIGGGTPTILPSALLRRMMEDINSHFSFADNRSFCLEVKPTLVDDEQLAAAVECGCDRVSVGVQSMNAAAMKAANRDYADIGRLAKLVARLKELGVREINADLIGGLPGDDPEGFRESFMQVAGLGVSTIIIYFFRLENSQYSRKVKEQFSELWKDGYTKMFIDALEGVAAEAGYAHTTSNPYSVYQEFIRSDYEGCRLEKHHTEWTAKKRNSCLGLGVGAKSSILNAAEFLNFGPHGLASADVAKALECELDFSTVKYLTIAIGELERMRDYALRTLYLSGYVSASEFNQIFRKNIVDVFGEEISALTCLGKMAVDGDRYVILCEGFDRAAHLKFFCDQAELMRICKNEPPDRLWSF